MLQVGQLRPRYAQMAPSKLGRQSPVLNMILLVWKPENIESVVNWGCWCFWSFEVRLIHCDSRDLEYTIGSTLAYHECCRNPELAIQPPKEFAQPAARSRKKP